MTQQPSDWVLVGGEVLIGDDRVRRDLVVTGSTLAAVVPPGQAPADLPQVDAAGRLVTPGMIDTHIHGAAGVSFGAGDPTPALSWLAKHGTTTVVPSLVSGPVADMCQRADELTSQTPAPEAAAIAGVHLEGPFLSVAQCGAQDPKHLVSPAESSWQEWLPRPSVAMVTLAAERDGSPRAGVAARRGDGAGLRTTGATARAYGFGRPRPRRPRRSGAVAGRPHRQRHRPRRGAALTPTSSI
ncbi:amidohydrolase family protein [Parenemella sanctibonifatiensis]|uniref:Uncharacterized protein n=1 Tax=Parenemella sanctibonifatiensis TaxID=2016505 RepID=A0A255E1J4_9ACTN|nr:amidohydrolase family protein [Parenemella sanctibonifatiensis]OYN85210.1 hypothetical protein CGZ92_10355 [Parenemella sanctibonifatiensis]